MALLIFEPFSNRMFVPVSAPYDGLSRPGRWSRSSQRFWSAHWNVPARERRVQRILPYPCADLIVAGGGITIIGVVTRAAIRQLEGSGSAFGAKLHPGALRALGVARPSTLRAATERAALRVFPRRKLARLV